MYKKPIIVFEGIEGSGKSTQINNVALFLKKKKISFLKLREPGGSYNSEKIRNLILNQKSKFNNKTDLLLYLAARSENIDIIKKNMKKKIILLDRFIDSTIAYQHYGMGIDLKIINTINKFLIKDIKIDYTFLNIVNKKNMLSRLKKRKKLNRYDKFNYSFYSKVQSGFVKLSKKKFKKYSLINSNLSIDNNKKEIIKMIKKLI
jgi:dTMP kinase